MAILPDEDNNGDKNEDEYDYNANDHWDQPVP